jgi:hypothetical protein
MYRQAVRSGRVGVIDRRPVVCVKRRLPTHRLSIEWNQMVAIYAPEALETILLAQERSESTAVMVGRVLGIIVRQLLAYRLADVDL